MRKRRKTKKYIRLAIRTLVYSLIVTIFTFVAVPMMEMLMTNYNSRTVIHLGVCLAFGLWFGEKIFDRKKEEM